MSATFLQLRSSLTSERLRLTLVAGTKEEFAESLPGAARAHGLGNELGREYQYSLRAQPRRVLRPDLMRCSNMSTHPGPNQASLLSTAPSARRLVFASLSASRKSTISAGPREWCRPSAA